MPRKTEVNPDEVAMRKHGAHVWTTDGGQTFWCFCHYSVDHTSQPRWA